MWHLPLGANHNPPNRIFPALSITCRQCPLFARKRSCTMEVEAPLCPPRLSHRPRHLPAPSARSISAKPSVLSLRAYAVGLQVPAGKIHSHQTKPFSTPIRTKDNHFHPTKQTGFRTQVSRLNSVRPHRTSFSKQSQITPASAPSPAPQPGLAPTVPQAPPTNCYAGAPSKVLQCQGQSPETESRPNDWDHKWFPIQRLGRTPWDIA
jgi:hypothetical protein